VYPQIRFTNPLKTPIRIPCASANARAKSALSRGRMLRIATSRIMLVFPLLTPRARIR
jgi:hypothetical protein